MPPSLYPTVTLKPGRERSLERRHPWIFSGAIGRREKGIKPGSLVSVVSSDGQPCAIGHAFDSSIAVKILSFEDRAIDEAFFCERFTDALALRTRLGIAGDSATTAYRLFNAEGDGVPGLIIDRYGGTVVLQFQNTALEQHRGEIAAALRSVIPTLRAAYALGDEGGDEPREGRGSYLFGENDGGAIKESGLSFVVDWERGQKTGFFLDQRENRRLLSRYSSGKRVLNTFCYSGGFSVSAAAGGATAVHSVDASEAALELCRRNLDLNPGRTQHTVTRADCMKLLGTLEERYDVVVLDPPAFAKRREAVDGALRGYENLNVLGMRLVEAGGLLFTFSCSQMVLRDDFRKAVLIAAARAGRRAQIVHELHQAPCHPVSIFHPEGEYLKGFVLAVS